MSVLLTGLNGANPLGYLAALGTQQALADQGLPVRMRWMDVGGWRPELLEVASLDEVLDALQHDLQSWQQEPALSLTYPAIDKRTGKPKTDKKTGEPVIERDLKPPPAMYAEFMRRMRERGSRSEAFALAFATDVGVDGAGFAKPTAMHFTAGQQRFLEMVLQLRDGVTRDHLQEALKGPWRNRDELPVLAWNAASERMYALRAFDPSKDKKTGTAGAEWLAFLGLRCLPTVPDGSSTNMTTGVWGVWKSGRFAWLLWTVPLGPEAVRSVVQQIHCARDLPPPALRAWGIGQVFESAIRRTDQGGYGSLSPPRILR